MVKLPNTKPCLRIGHIHDVERCYAEFWDMHKFFIVQQNLPSVWENNKFNELLAALNYLEKAIINLGNVMRKYDIR